MKSRVVALTLAVCLFSPGPAWAAATKQTFRAGWDVFSEPLNYTASKVTWSLSLSRKLTITYTLVGAQPNHLYQVGVHFFCSTTAPNFGQFPVWAGAGGACVVLTREGTTRAVAASEFGVVTTDRNGKGSFKIVVGPIAPGSYELEFTVRNGAGCNVSGGGSGPSVCWADFQSPGPFGVGTTTIVVP